MEKIKITQGQAEIIKRLLGQGFERAGIVAKHDRGWKEDYNSALNTLQLDTVIRALYIGYEVEPEFKVGDWVYVGEGVMSGWKDKTGKVTEVRENIITIDVRLDVGLRNDIRHATPSEIVEEKERRWWKKHGRDVWELKKGDVIKGKGYITNLWKLGFVKRHYSNIIVLEDISDGSEIEVHKDLSYVVTFVENRLDVKKNNN